MLPYGSPQHLPKDNTQLMACRFHGCSSGNAQGRGSGLPSITADWDRGDPRAPCQPPAPTDPPPGWGHRERAAGSRSCLGNWEQEKGERQPLPWRHRGLEGEVVPSELSWIFTIPGMRNYRYPTVARAGPGPGCTPRASRCLQARKPQMWIW